MEMRMLRTLEFDLGMPLSYRFLRRFAKVSIAGSLLDAVALRSLVLKHHGINRDMFIRCIPTYLSDCRT